MASVSQSSERCVKREPLVVVLTGGPSSGKSSALALLRDRLSTRGYQVLTVPENATHFLTNSDGFQAEWAGTDEQVKMQRVFLDFQMSQEQAFRDFAALHPTKPAVLLLDCCTLNSKVYLSDEQWEKALVLPGKPALTEEELLKRYDLVIHMVTVAVAGAAGGYEWGPGSNNPGRYHTPEQAQETDKRSLEVFAKHPQLREVPHCNKFEDKIGKVVEFVNDALQIEGLVGKRRRQACRITRPEELEACLSQASTSCSAVACTFLDRTPMTHSVRKDVRMAGTAWAASFKYDGGFCPEGVVTTCAAEVLDVLYERRHKVLAEHAETGESYLTRRVISQADYIDAVSSSPKAPTVTKHVLRFLVDGQYYELFFFEAQLFVLDFSDEDHPPPAWLELIDDEVEAHKDSEMAALQTAYLKHGICETPTKFQSILAEAKHALPEHKPPRVLRAVTTEEAAYSGFVL